MSQIIPGIAKLFAEAPGMIGAADIVMLKERCKGDRCQQESVFHPLSRYMAEGISINCRQKLGGAHMHHFWHKHGSGESMRKMCFR